MVMESTVVESCQLRTFLGLLVIQGFTNCRVLTQDLSFKRGFKQKAFVKTEALRIFEEAH